VELYLYSPCMPSWCGTPWRSLLRHYKPEGRGCDSQWCHWDFSLTQSFRSYYGPGVNSASIRNEYQKYILGGKGGRWVGLTTLPPSCASCLDILEASSSWIPKGLYRYSFTFTKMGPVLPNIFAKSVQEVSVCFFKNKIYRTWGTDVNTHRFNVSH
jgi:hypothetical protein